MTEGSVVEGAGGVAVAVDALAPAAAPAGVGAVAGGEVTASGPAGAAADVELESAGGSAQTGDTASAIKTTKIPNALFILNLLKCGGVALAGADAHDLLEVQDEDLAVAHLGGF